MLPFFLFKVLILLILVPLIGVICRRWDNSIRPIVLTITAIGTLLIAFFTDLVSEKLSDPQAEVDINRKGNELSIHVKSKEVMQSLAIDLPILGKIINIHDNNSITDARASLKRIIGEQTEYSQNNVEFLIENIKPRNTLEYKILFEPMPRNIAVVGIDRYKISYSWFHNGNLKSRTKWISFEEKKELGRPGVEIKGLTIHSRALTPEEIKKRYQDGLKKVDTEQ